MVGSERKAWTEQDEIDAARLLAVLEHRSNKRKTADRPAAQIQDRPLSQGEKADGESMGSSMLDRRPQFTQPRRNGSDHVAERGRNSNGLEMGNGRAALGSEPISRRTDSCARPDPDVTIGLEDRAVYTLRGFD